MAGTGSKRLGSWGGCAGMKGIGLCGCQLGHSLRQLVASLTAEPQEANLGWALVL